MKTNTQTENVYTATYEVCTYSGEAVTASTRLQGYALAYEAFMAAAVEAACDRVVLFAPDGSELRVAHVHTDAEGDRNILLQWMQPPIAIDMASAFD